MRRRRFLVTLAVVPAAAAIGCRPKAPTVRQDGQQDGCQVARRDARSARLLTPAQWEALDAACERILPRDQDPGASEAGVINYIDAQLTSPPINSLRSLLEAGALELDRLAAARGGRRFHKLAPDEQDRVLTEIQHSRMGRYSGARFFEVLLSLTLEGFFSDPVYGGNRDRVGWKLIGFVPRGPGADCAFRGMG